MRKMIIALGATVCILVAEPVAFAVAITLATFQVVLSIGRRNWPGALVVSAYTVYHYDLNRHVREPIGKVVERRRRERGNNLRDLLTLAHRIHSASLPNSLVFLCRD